MHYMHKYADANFRVTTGDTKTRPHRVRHRHSANAMSMPNPVLQINIISGNENLCDLNRMPNTWWIVCSNSACVYSQKYIATSLSILLRTKAKFTSHLQLLSHLLTAITNGTRTKSQFIYSSAIVRRKLNMSRNTIVIPALFSYINVYVPNNNM